MLADADNGSSNTSKCSSPEHRSDSRGSSVSAGLREEYEDLLRYAVVAPKLNGRAPHHVMSVPHPALPRSQQNRECVSVVRVCMRVRVCARARVRACVCACVCVCVCVCV